MRLICLQPGDRVLVVFERLRRFHIERRGTCRRRRRIRDCCAPDISPRSPSGAARDRKDHSCASRFPAGKPIRSASPAYPEASRRFFRAPFLRDQLADFLRRLIENERRRAARQGPPGFFPTAAAPRRALQVPDASRAAAARVSAAASAASGRLGFDRDDQLIRLREVLEKKRETLHLRQVRRAAA